VEKPTFAAANQMQAKPPTPKTFRSIEKNVDRKILALFPSLNFCNLTANPEEKRKALADLACLQMVGVKGAVSASELAQTLKISRADANKSFKKLASGALVREEKNGKTAFYLPTTLGTVALMMFGEFQDWTKTKASLCAPQKKNDPLAYALLVVGYCANKPDGLYQALCKYAAQGHVMEQVEAGAAADSLLGFYRQELRLASAVPPNYLSVFKEFTTAGFQDVFRMLLLAMKPTAEDYNWLLEFFNEVAEFYFDPARVTYVNLLAQNPTLKQHLEAFKKTQDQQIKKEGSNLEVTFTIPGAGASKIESMPPHLRAIGMRLILEPVKFINKELFSYFWP
jgi:hypothetical protein